MTLEEKGFPFTTAESAAQQQRWKVGEKVFVVYFCYVCKKDPENWTMEYTGNPGLGMDDPKIGLVSIGIEELEINEHWLVHGEQERPIMGPATYHGFIAQETGWSYPPKPADQPRSVWRNQYPRAIDQKDEAQDYVFMRVDASGSPNELPRVRAREIRRLLLGFDNLLRSRLPGSERRVEYQRRQQMVLKAFHAMFPDRKLVRTEVNVLGTSIVTWNIEQVGEDH